MKCFGVMGRYSRLLKWHLNQVEISSDILKRSWLLISWKMCLHIIVLSYYWFHVLFLHQVKNVILFLQKKPTTVILHYLLLIIHATCVSINTCISYHLYHFSFMFYINRRSFELETDFLTSWGQQMSGSLTNLIIPMKN